MRPDATLAAPAMMAGKDIAKVRFIVSLLLVSCLGMLFALCVVPVRAGGIWDSVAYAGTARNIAKGLGFFMAHRLPLVPLTNWPPLYPIILAGPAYFGIDPAVSARWINGLFMGCSTFFAGFIAWAYCGRSYAMGILAVLSILLSPDIIEIHSQILSEPPFIAFTLACIAGLLLYAESGKTKHLIAAALAISAALVTRYAGIFLLAGAALALVLNWRHLKQRKTPFIDLGLAFIIAILPSCAWSVHNLLMNGRAVGGRKFVIHWLGLQRLRDLFRTVTLWFTTAVVSPSIRFVVLVVLLAVGLSTLVSALRSKRQIAEPCFRLTLLLAEICLVFDLLYLILLFVTISFFDASTTMEPRLLVPIFPVTALLFVSCLALRREMFGRQSVGYRVLVVVGLLIVISNAVRFSVRFHDIRVNGVGFQTAEWRDDEVINYVRGLSFDTVLYSDNPALLYDATQRAPYSMPAKFDIDTTSTNNEFEENMKDLAELGTRRNVVVILFQPGWLNGPLPVPSELMEMGFHPIFRSAKGGYVLRAGVEGSVK